MNWFYIHSLPFFGGGGGGGGGGGQETYFK